MNRQKKTQAVQLLAEYLHELQAELPNEFTLALHQLLKTVNQSTIARSGPKKSQVKNVSLSWVDNSSGADNEDAFVIERCEETGRGKTKTCVFAELDTVGSDVTNYNDVPGGASYKYRVKARRSGSSDSDYSNELKI